MKYLFVFLLIGLVSCGDDATGDASAENKANATGDATGDATGEATEEAKNEIAKQPNCDEVEGMELVYYLSEPNKILVPDDYTGVVFKCKDGKVIALLNYKDGKWIGVHRVWYENGQLKEEIYYKDGKEDGLHRVWYENGQLSYEGNKKDGEPYGLSRYWHENGQLRFEEYSSKVKSETNY